MNFFNTELNDNISISYYLC